MSKNFKFYSKTIFLFAFLLLITKNYGQQQTKINVFVDDIAHFLDVKQTITITNNSNKSLSKLVLNDWNHAYSSKYSPLGKRFSDEYVRNFHLASEFERGKTTIDKMLINDSIATWSRVSNHLDIIEIELKEIDL